MPKSEPTSATDPTVPSESDLPRLLARAALDSEFRAALADSPERTARITGFQLTPDEAAVLSAIRVHEWDNLSAKEVQNRIGMLLAGYRITNVTVTQAE